MVDGAYGDEKDSEDGETSSCGGLELVLTLEVHLDGVSKLVDLSQKAILPFLLIGLPNAVVLSVVRVLGVFVFSALLCVRRGSATLLFT